MGRQAAWRLLVWASVLSCGMLRSAPAEGAIDDYLGKEVGSIRLVLEGRDTTEPAIVRMVETRVGEALTVALVRDSIAHLFSLGRFDDIRVDASLEAGRVALRYELSPIHPVASMQFTGPLSAPGVDTGQLRQAIVDRYGTSPSLGRVEELKQVITDQLVERGYLHPDIQAQARIAHDPDRATLVFTLDPGIRTTVGTIDIDGTPSVSTKELLGRLDLSNGAPYRRDALNQRIDRYIEDRRKAGYYEAKLIVRPVLVDGDRTANLLLTVTPGPKVRVAFTGDSLPAAVKRDDLVPVEREGSVDEDLLEDSTNRIEEALRAEGYRDAKAPHARQVTGGELLVTFTVTRGPEYRVDRVEIQGNGLVPLSDFEPALRLRAGTPFSESKLDADLAAIDELYHRRGFVSARARAATEPQTAAGAASVVPLLVRIVIAEGPRTVVSAVRIEGSTIGPENAWKDGLGLQPGRPYFERQLALDREALQLQYVNDGYPNAVVDVAPGFTTDRTGVELVFTVRTGPRILVDHVLIIGNVRTSTETIERELRIKAGDPISEAAKGETRRRLAALGLFRRVQISELAHGDEGRRDVVVTVEESLATTVVYGAGAEGRLRSVRSAEEGGAASEKLDIAPRGSFEISRRNVFGKNRSVSLFTSASVHLQNPDVFDENGNLTSTGRAGITEYRLLGTYREPRLFDTSATGTITGTFEQQVRTSFNFARRGASAEIIRRLSSRIGVSGSYQIQRTRVFDQSIAPADQLLIDRLFPQVRLSSVSSSIVGDTRDDPVDPHAGEYVSGNVQIAGRRIGSEVGFAKTFMRAQLFRVVPRASRLVFAGNASLGLATAFTRDLITVDADGHVVTQSVEDLPASERFFAGGDNGPVRGFTLDALGTPSTLDKDGFPIGGNGVVILNAEVRAAMFTNVQAVGFLDAGNVFAHATDIDLGSVRGAVGFGVRYKSPFGPIRVDLGFKMHREIIAGARENLTALVISLGQAF